MLLRGLPKVFRSRQLRSLSFDVERVRNVGVVAHIDAGKTTLTERLLYLSGEVKRMGDVDSGSTVTDFLEVERERGITVQSALVSLPWKDHTIHLIDTPGHVDFGIEVQRCVRVLDGLLVVLDASAGVQAQTLTVWRQAAIHSLPAVFLINKMDKPNASHADSLRSVEDKLGIRALPVVTPLMVDDHLKGFVNLLTKEYLGIEDTGAQWTKIKTATREWDALTEHRENLLLHLADVDTHFATVFLDECGGVVARVPEGEVMGDRDLTSALMRASLTRNASVVATGSALRSVASVRPCLDLINSFLPSPSKSTNALGQVLGGRLGALVFKISHDKRKGKLAYTRIYSGEVRSGTHLWNWTKGKREGPIEVLEAQSDELSTVKKAAAGSIVVLRNVEYGTTGDTLLDEKHEKYKLPEVNDKEDESMREARRVLFHGIDEPDPVVYCSIEPPDTRGKHALERALHEILVEDPSLRLRRDAETGQTILETQGELHVEIVKDRLVRGYGLNVFLGPLQVSYREVLTNTVEHTGRVEDTVDGRTYWATVTLRLSPKEGMGKHKRVLLALPPNSQKPRVDWMQAVNEGVSPSLHNGPLLGFPVYDVQVSLVDITASGGRVGANLVCAAAHKCMEESLRKGGTRLVEPVMEAEVTIPTDGHSQGILHELIKRRATIEETSGDNEIRTLSHGLAHLHLRPIGHQLLDAAEENRLLRERTL